MHVLTAIPVYNEARHLEGVLGEVRRYSPRILVVDDGSTDATAEILARQAGIEVVTHPHNRGYGAALVSGFAHARRQGADVLVTMDCDGQHEPARIPVLLEALHDADVVSGSRYLRDFRQDTLAPQDRRRINAEVTAFLNSRFGLHLTHAFCVFKAYRPEALARRPAASRPHPAGPPLARPAPPGPRRGRRRRLRVPGPARRAGPPRHRRLAPARRPPAGAVPPRRLGQELRLARDREAPRRHA